MTSLKSRQVRYAALVGLLLVIVIVVLRDIKRGWGATFGSYERLKALISAKSTGRSAPPQLLQHLLVSDPPTSFAPPGLEARPFLALYVFSTCNVAGYMRRELIRRRSPLLRLPERYRSLVQLRFVLGRPTGETNLFWTLPDDIRAEQDEHGDLLLLDEDLDGGRSVAWMQSVGRGDPVQWVFKSNEDTLVNLPNLLEEVLQYSPEEPTHIGTTLGRSTNEPLYFTGALYGFSWPVLAAVGAASLTQDEVHLPRHEDVRVGDVMHSLPSAPDSPELSSQFPCLPRCEGQSLDKLQSLVQVNGNDAWVSSNPRTGLRYVNVLSRIGDWHESVSGRARATVLAWYGLESDKDFVEAFNQASAEWEPSKQAKEQLHLD